MDSDLQIIATALTQGAHTLYSDDAGIRRFVKQTGLDLKVDGTANFALPPVDMRPVQQDLLSPDPL